MMRRIHRLELMRQAERKNNMWKDLEFTYKDHVCNVEHMHEPDVVKAWHSVTKPNGERVFADITPYDSTELTLKMWVDAGYPKRIGCGPLHREDLQEMIANQKEVIPFKYFD